MYNKVHHPNDNHLQRITQIHQGPANNSVQHVKQMKLPNNNH